MKPILLKGHERSITYIKYNREGDLLFTAAKSTQPCVWYTDNGERIGTYKGHTGAVWSLDVTRDSSQLLTASADMTSRLFDCETGKELNCWNHRAPVRWVSLGDGDRIFLTVTDQVMGKESTIWIYDKSRPTPIREIINPNARMAQGHWGPLNKTIIAPCDDHLTSFDFETGKVLKQARDHQKAIGSCGFSEDKSHFITSSTDHTARLYDTRSLEILKTYEFGRPVNTAAICPIKDLIMLGGGQSAEQVTTTRLDSSQFRIRFFHKIFEEEIASIPGHFGPVNTLAFAPDGSFSSGGEDGFVRIHNLEDPTFFALGDEAEDSDDDF